MAKKRTYLTRSSTKNRRIDDLTRSSKKNKRSYFARRPTKNKTICNEGETDGLLISGDMGTESNQDVLSELSDDVVSNLSRNVVSLSLYDVSLATTLPDKRKDHDNLKIVRHGDSVVIGFLCGYNLGRDIAVVSVNSFPGLHGVDFRECEGDPLYDFHGNFLGMNVSSCTEGTLCVPEIRVLDQCLSLKMIKFPAQLTSFKEVRVGESSNGEMAGSQQEVHKDMLNEDQFGDLESLGYPERPKSMPAGESCIIDKYCTFYLQPDGIILAYNFEETFGDLQGEGEKRFFACTGCFIEWNEGATILTAANLIRESRHGHETVKNLRIKVLLPSKNQVDGILQHYNLHYNIALVSVNDYCPSHRRIFKSGKLMASRGRNIRMKGTLDCNFLEYSTCRISKAGIGGPLLDFEGNFVGVNFYDKYSRGTPFLLWDEVLDVLRYFKNKRTIVEAGHDDYASQKLDWRIPGDSSFRINRPRIVFEDGSFWIRKPYPLVRRRIIPGDILDKIYECKILTRTNIVYNQIDMKSGRN
ncbi:hypothetical protein U9M48_027324 [Paspalum notatum var. saurae]|uniref:Uncharacterized protein n=1 Tax=Paspalum notatum var. saurae TaxID=547442 RepID=A0AAQ3TZ84_PASNO